MHKIPVKLSLFPEEAEYLNDLLSMTEAQMFSKYGPLGDNIQFEIDMGNTLKAWMTLQPHPDKTPTLIFDLTKDGIPLPPQIELSDVKSITGALTLKPEGYEVTITIEVDESLRRIGNDFVYQAIGEDERYLSHNGEVCKIHRALTTEECDILCVGLMWEAEFPNGDVMHVFDDELKAPVSPKELNKASLQEQIDSAKPQISDKALNHQDPEKGR